MMYKDFISISDVFFNNYSTLMTVIFFITGLTGCVTKSQLEDPYEYNSLNLEEAEVTPSEEKLNDPYTRVVVLKPNIKDSENSIPNKYINNLTRDMENIIEKSAGARLPERSTNESLQEEIVLAQKKRGSQGNYEGPEAADYAVEINFKYANLAGDFWYSDSFKGKYGKTKYIAPRCNYKFSVEGTITIYKLPSKKSADKITIKRSLKDYKSLNKPVNSKICNPKDGGYLIKKFTENLISSYKSQIFDFFEPKGYITEGRVKNGDFIFEVNLGKEHEISSGEKVKVFRRHKIKNPLTGSEIEKKPVASGFVTNEIGSEESWIRLRNTSEGPNIKLGYVVQLQ